MALSATSLLLALVSGASIGLSFDARLTSETKRALRAYSLLMLLGAASFLALAISLSRGPLL